MQGNPIGVIGAMDTEIELLREHMHEAGEVNETVAAGMTFYEGCIAGVPSVLVQCGVGMVNAAVCAQILIDKFQCAAVMNTGVAGSLDAKINIGDIVVATDAVNHIMDVRNLGYWLGQTPGCDVVAFPLSSSLRHVFVHAASEMGINVHQGRVASGDRFVRDDAEKAHITETFQAKCCEMEGAAIANVAYLSSVPCAIVRAISDKADGSASMDYPIFEAQAARQCAQLVIKAFENLAEEEPA